MQRLRVGGCVSDELEDDVGGDGADEADAVEDCEVIAGDLLVYGGDNGDVEGVVEEVEEAGCDDFDDVDDEVSGGFEDQVGDHGDYLLYHLDWCKGGEVFDDLRFDLVIVVLRNPSPWVTRPSRSRKI